MPKSNRAGKYAGQTPTTATSIENMNEAQLDREISKAQKLIAAAEKKMAQSLGQSAYASAMEEAFPLSPGGAGWTQAGKNAQSQELQSTLKKAKQYSDARDRRDEAQSRLDALTAAKKDVAGTGKTQQEIKAEQKAASATSVKWSSSKNGNQTVYTTDGGTITHNKGGFYWAHVNGQNYSYTKLSDAKAAVVMLKKKK